MNSKVQIAGANIDQFPFTITDSQVYYVKFNIRFPCLVLPKKVFEQIFKVVVQNLKCDVNVFLHLLLELLADFVLIIYHLR